MYICCKPSAQPATTELPVLWINTRTPVAHIPPLASRYGGGEVSLALCFWAGAETETGDAPHPVLFVIFTSY